jgi:hypothetical protein
LHVRDAPAALTPKTDGLKEPEDERIGATGSRAIRNETAIFVRREPDAASAC